MRLSRGIWILGVAATFFALGGAYVTVFAYMLLCLDSCPDVSGMILSGQPLGFIDLLLPLVFLVPSLTMILAAWIWEIADLRRMSAGRTRVSVALFPLIAIVVGVTITLLISVMSHGRAVSHIYGVWPGTYSLVSLLSGIYALVLWPLLVTLVAIFWRRPAQSGALPPPPRAASDSA
jgi:hypothetical protein